MICQNCNKEFPTLSGATVEQHKTKTFLSFCCYECYLEFWKGVKEFIPLPQWKNKGGK